jgi:hypothetical protein
MTNEAAERLYVLLAEFICDERAAERRATVERIEEQLAEIMVRPTEREKIGHQVQAILDAEAER